MGLSPKTPGRTTINFELFEKKKSFVYVTICIGENRSADQLRGNREADQRLCFRYLDKTIPPLTSPPPPRGGLCSLLPESQMTVLPSSLKCLSSAPCSLKPKMLCFLPKSLKINYPSPQIAKSLKEIALLPESPKPLGGPLLYLTPKFQASSYFLCLFASDLFGNHIAGFPTRWLNYDNLDPELVTRAKFLKKRAKCTFTVP